MANRTNQHTYKRICLYSIEDTLAIISDHENKTWVDANTGQVMNTDYYGDDLNDPGCNQTTK